MTNQTRWSEADYEYMRRALELAETQRGKTSPDPMVGAVLVKDGKVLSEGYHSHVKTPHAEAWAIKKAGEAARGATLYVSLEPCCFFWHKNNPPCTKTIISAGIKKVIMAMTDPNPMVSGRGLAEIKQAGIETDVGLMGEAAKKLNEVFIKYITTSVPFITIKSAMSLDGKIATPSGESFWISGLEARTHSHYLRSINDAIMVGIGTVKKDNPELTVRHVSGANPKKIIVDPELEISTKSKVFQREPERTIILTLRKRTNKKKQTLQAMGVEFLEFPANAKKINLAHAMQELGKRKIASILVEGGGGLIASCLKFGVADKVSFFIAPKIIGGKNSPTPVEGGGIKKISEAFMLKNLEVSFVGSDLLVEGYLIH